MLGETHQTTRVYIRSFAPAFAETACFGTLSLCYVGGVSGTPPGWTSLASDDYICTSIQSSVRLEPLADGQHALNKAMRGIQDTIQDSLSRSCSSSPRPS